MSILTVSDFDGTLYNNEGVIEERVISAIREYIFQGNFFTVCTGRTFRGFHRYDSTFINAPIILANGAMAYDYKNGEIVFCEGLGEESFRLIRTIRDRYPTVSIELYGLERTFVIHNTDRSRWHFNSFLDTDYLEISDPSEAEPPFVKIMLGCDHGESFDIQLMLRREFPEIGFIPMEGVWVEILKKGVNKGTGMLRLAEILGVNPAKTNSIGDGDNDVDMLLAAGNSFVPANGTPMAKSAGKTSVPSNNDGAVMHALNIILKKQGC